MPTKAILNFVIAALFAVLLGASIFKYYLDYSFLNTIANFAESTALTVLFSVALIKAREFTEKLEPLFWYLITAAFFSWLVFNLSLYFILDTSAESTRGFASDLSYFIFCVLLVASIEVKSFSEARKFISRRSLITSISLFLFMVGSFSYFILAPTESAKLQQANNNSFYFYALMDGYLALRWWHISQQETEQQRKCYLLLASASIVWLVVDILRINAQHLAEINWQWLNLLPFVLIYTAIVQYGNHSDHERESKYFRRYHIFNSPIFFLGIISIILLSQDDFFGSEKTQAIRNIELAWVLSTLALSFFQALELFETNKFRKLELKRMQKKYANTVSELENRSKQLDDQRNASQTILDSVTNPIFTLSLDGRIQSCNTATQLLLGYTEKDLIGTSFTELVPATEEFHHFFDYQSYRQQLARNKSGLELESKLNTKDGNEVIVHISLSQGNQAIRDRIIVSLADIREQKKAEQQLHDLRDQFTANISHEFRTPLTIVNGVIDELLNAQIGQRYTQSLETAKRNNLRLIHMVDQLLEVSRLNAESIVIGDLNASDWLAPLCQSYQTIANDKKIDFQLSICEPVLIHGNQQAFEKILYNLLSNAFKYTREGGSVNVVLEEYDNNYQLTIADTGIGISKHEQSNVFNRFQRSESLGDASIPGVGIGLALVKDLVTAMQWTIELSSVVNKGSQFIVTIPKANKSIDELPTTDKRISDSSQIALLTEEVKVHDKTAPVRKSKYMVLIIEDNFDMQRHLETIISPHHQCLVASNGTQGLNMAEEFLPDLILCDVMMPGIDGFEVLTRLKSESMTAHIPVIMLTAKTDRKSKLKGLKNEAEDYISKPFDAEELLLKLTNQINVRKKLQQQYEAQWRGFSENKSIESEPEPGSDFLQELNTYFEANYTDSTYSMNQLANQLAMSDRQLQRKVKALVDISPLELLKRFRLEKAKSQLRQNIQIGLVAQSCGFSSQTYFGRCFKEHFGVTPKKYQQS